MTFVLEPAPRLLLSGNRAEDRRRATAWRRQCALDVAGVERSPEAQRLAELRRRRDVLDEAAALGLELAWPKTVERLRRVGVAVAPARRRRRRLAAGYAAGPMVLTR